MIPEDLERQISLAKAEVSEWEALGQWSGAPLLLSRRVFDWPYSRHPSLLPLHSMPVFPAG